MPESRSIVFQHEDSRKLTSRPSTLRAALAKVALPSFFDLPVDAIALEVDLGGVWVEVMEDARDSAVMTARDPLLLRVVRTQGKKVGQEMEDEERSEAAAGQVEGREREVSAGASGAARESATATPQHVGRPIKRSSSSQDELPSPLAPAARAPPPPPSSSVGPTSSTDRLHLRIRWEFETGPDTIVLTVKPTVKVAKVIEAFSERLGYDEVRNVRFMYNHNKFDGGAGQVVGDYGVQDHDIVTLAREQLG